MGPAPLRHLLGSVHTEETAVEPLVRHFLKNKHHKNGAPKKSIINIGLKQ